MDYMSAQIGVPSKGGETVSSGPSSSPRGTQPSSPTASSSLVGKRHSVSIRCYGKGRPAPADIRGRFVSLLTEASADELASDWEFTPELALESYPAHRDIFPVQVYGTTAADNGDGDVDQELQNLKAITVKMVTQQLFQGTASTPTFLVFVVPARTSATSTKSRGKCLGLMLLEGHGVIGKDTVIPKTPSSWMDAAIDGLFTAIFPAVLIFGVGYYSVRHFSKESQGRANHSTPKKSKVNSNPGLAGDRTNHSIPRQIAASLLEQAKDNGSWSGAKKALEDILNHAESARDFFSRNSGAPAQSIPDAQAQLSDFHTTTETHFQRLNTKMQTLNLSNDKVTLTTEDSLEIVGLFMNLANAQLTQKEGLTQLFPLLEKKYSREKGITHRSIALVGGVAAACALAAALGFLPAVPGLLWLTNGAGAIKAAVALGGTSACLVSDSQANTNFDDCAKRDKVRTTDEVLRASRDQFLCYLLASLLADVDFSNVSLEDKVEIYKRMGGVRIDLFKETEYVQAGMNTAWEQLSKAIRENQEAVKKLT